MEMLRVELVLEHSMAVLTSKLCSRDEGRVGAAGIPRHYCSTYSHKQEAVGNENRRSRSRYDGSLSMHARRHLIEGGLVRA